MRADTMVLMLPTLADNGARLAAIMPTALAAMQEETGIPTRIGVPELRSVVLVVVDGLGHSNLKARSAHARTLSSLPTRRIETVIPSTTGAALPAITTGTLPGEHGLIGYRIKHPELGLVTTLKDWDGIEPGSTWLRSEPLFNAAHNLGVRPIAIGRAAHATGGLTEAMLSGAEYHGANTIQDRFTVASRLLHESDRALIYLYIDELDRAAHKEGWQSIAWASRLEQLDAALTSFLRVLPADVGVILTADHGIVDIAEEGRFVLDDGQFDLSGVQMVGGEPRFRSLYLSNNEDPTEVANRVAGSLGRLAWVGTRESAIEHQWFGPTTTDVAERLGEVLVIARAQVAFMLEGDSLAARSLVGQHGGISEDERGVPLALGGALAGTGFAAAVQMAASARLSR